ncbi:tRNA(Met) cytidine acetyltransferase TmcA [Natronorubrum daqingense]|uniref:tRNA(Met) cytidine acetyltransferase TmcA n=1 Tax=Natronorubrum daqingense TaxID=588898 RepID=A0A1N7EDJ2_9EURY|nr:tRNA(Met) cytidine acetyltransferase TmcA [Natronorubrum daqingense]APX96505.1 tRNA cytosine(34) acetyltransferase TmcA [Natronorubrum daqingense]SIR86089.1 tRNA(Met) cytidine acetyltransferase [Natronorubrum daqingense]
MDAVAVDLANSLFEEAQQTNERRLLVLAGERERGYETLASVLESLPIPITATTLVGPDDRLRCEQLPQSNASELLGTTRDAIALDAHAGLRPNALGKLVGAVDGGGLLIFLTPSLDEWPTHRGEFAQSLAVPPYSLSDVTSNFKRRLIDTLRAHRGIGIVDLEAERIVDSGLTEPSPKLIDSRRPDRAQPPDGIFPTAVYEACLTADQSDAVATLESIDPRSASSVEEMQPPESTPESHRPSAVVLEADRGRGKSSAAGLAAGAMAAAGHSVLVTAPRSRNVSELFERATALYEALPEVTVTDETPRHLETSTGGRVQYLEPTEATARLEPWDAVIVDEAAALPVSRLESFLEADRVAFATTIHGYEGAGRGFSVRFRDRLADAEHEVVERTLLEPIRYAGGDPIEVWAFNALLLDARPPVESLVDDARPETVEYRRIEPSELVSNTVDDTDGNERLLREAFGLLVLAHYRTTPDDLARLLDAPNLEARALLTEPDAAGSRHVASVALLAREGNLSAETRRTMYEGGRVRGNMLPDVLTSQLRDEAAASPSGLRVVRIATHHAVRSNGLGSHVLECIHDEFADSLDWLGTGFGATPDLLSFWRENGYRTVHLSTTRNEASGEHSALMLAPTSDSGRTLHDRHAEWFASRVQALCTDSLATLEPDTVREALRSVDNCALTSLGLSAHEWRLLAAAAYGPGLFDVDPGPFRDLIVHYFVENPPNIELTEREERLLVEKGLQARDWETVASRLEYHSTGQCKRALGDAIRPLVDHYGTDVAREVRERFRDP